MDKLLAFTSHLNARQLILLIELLPLVEAAVASAAASLELVDQVNQGLPRAFWQFAEAFCQTESERVDFGRVLPDYTAGIGKGFDGLQSAPGSMSDVLEEVRGGGMLRVAA